MIQDNINSILDKIKQLELQLQEELEARQEQLSYELRNHKVKFARAIRALHREYRVGLVEFFRTAEARHIITAPLIYSLIVPIALLDIAVSIYQHTCFRAYRIARVKRADYVIFDRHQLSYLNVIEKFNCLYCSYANGVIAFVREVSARTEQYWCPIKHARRVLAPHSRFHRFADYGDAQDYQDTLKRLRREFEDSEKPGLPTQED